MAPKMYYLEYENGKTVFKAKGVKTSLGVQYTYDALKSLLLDAANITFTSQVQFHRLPNAEGSGVSIKENLVKSYSLKGTKRT